MAFQNQFSLSLELTNLIPLSLAIADQTYQAAMRLARDLQNAGSDIVVEEDLTEIFGRSKIEMGTASSFRTIVSQSSHLTTWYNDIGLISGPGPTVTRAFTESHYFSTIVQCSFLVATHDRTSLAAAITRYFEKVAEGAPDGHQRRAIPGLATILGMLRACEDQTEKYDWRRQLLAVAASLGLNDDATHETIPETVLHGLLPMLPLAQTLPDDRYIVIRTTRGVCNIVIWAYVVLGMPILIRFHEDGRYREVRFPPNLPKNKECILVEVSSKVTPARRTNDATVREISIILLSTSTREELFKLKADPDEEETIDASYKAPARGIASRILDKAIPKSVGRDRVKQEMIAIACSFSFCIARKLKRVPPGVEVNFDDDSELQDDVDMNDFGGEEDDDKLLPSANINPENIYDAARFLFSITEKQLQRQLIEEYTSTFEGQSIYYIKDPPRCIQTFFEKWAPAGQWREVRALWAQLRITAEHLSIMVLAFAHITDLEACSDMPLCELSSLVTRSELSIAVIRWDGIIPITVKEDIWLQLVASLMIGPTGTELDLEQTALLSNRGWSIYVNTFGDADPSYVGEFILDELSSYLVIKNGVISYPWAD